MSSKLYFGGPIINSPQVTTLGRLSSRRQLPGLTTPWATGGKRHCIYVVTVWQRQNLNVDIKTEQRVITELITIKFRVSRLCESSSIRQ